MIIEDVSNSDGCELYSSCQIYYLLGAAFMGYHLAILNDRVD